jgi:thymidylate synthase (FAD)
VAVAVSEDTIPVLDHGFVRLDAAMASDLSVVNGARVSFARHKQEMDEADEGLIRFLMRERHGTPFEHNAFRFHVRCPIFVAREWFRHRVGCLTGDTRVTFVNGNGHAWSTKTLDELWRMWAEGEVNGHALTVAEREHVERLAAEGVSQRQIAHRARVGRRAVRSHLAGRNARRDARWRVKGMRLRVLDEAANQFVQGHISAVVDKGVQPVYRLRLVDGTTITLTENHRVLTSEGWARMAEAVGLVGRGPGASATRRCSLMKNGIPAHQDRDWLRNRRERGLSVSEIAAEAGCSYHTIRKWLRLHDLSFTEAERYRPRPPWNAGRRGYRINLVVTERHKEAIRRARSGTRSNFWRGGVTTDRASIGRWTTEQAPRVHARHDYTCRLCRRRGGALHAHHVIPVWVDEAKAREFENLATVCEPCHRKVHTSRDTELRAMAELLETALIAPDAVGTRRGFRLTAHPVAVEGVEYVGLEQTYDLCVEDPWHNFVANDVVVHNSFNEFSLRYAHATDEFYVPEPDDVRSQVGKPGAYSFEPVDDELAEETRDELREAYEEAYATYERLVARGVARELARAVLPVGAYTEFYWTVNARSLMNFISLRAAETAQREIRRYADACERFFADRMPVTHAAFVANDRAAP